MLNNSDHTKAWEVVGQWPFLWVPHFVAKLREQNLSPIDGLHVWVASDYSGAHRSSRFSSIGVLIADSDRSEAWHERRLLVRRQFLNDGRRMSFKSLNDGARRAALIPFLKAADAIRGLCVVLAIDKQLRNFTASDGFYEGLKELNIISARWKPHSFEHMATVTHVISVLLGLVSNSRQNITWISDTDECFATQEHKDDCARMMGKFGGMYLAEKMGILAMGTTELDEGDRFEEDLTAIPDLAAGAISELFNGMHSEFGKVPGITAFSPRKISRKSDIITSWFFAPNKWHQKIACVAQPLPGGRVQMGTVAADYATSLIIP